MPEKSIFEIGRQLAYQQCVGQHDINGTLWEEIFAKSIDGVNLSSPLGLADVVREHFSWSVKTVKAKKPHDIEKVRIISGRNNVTYSYDIENPLENIALTGEAVLSIFNERIKTAQSQYKGLRHSVFIRSEDLTQFTYFEKEAEFIDPKTVKWRKNKNGNLEGLDSSNNHLYTWQPNGSQFTIIYNIPDNAIRFTLKKPDVLDFEQVINVIGFEDNWITKI